MHNLNTIEARNLWSPFNDGSHRLFRAQFQKELTTNEDNRKWVFVLQTIVADINSTKTRLTGIAPVEAIKFKQA